MLDCHRDDLRQPLPDNARQSESTDPADVERLRLAMEATTDGVWDVDLKTRRVYANPRLASLIGFEPQEINHSLETWLGRMHPDDAVEARQLYDDHLVGKAPMLDVVYRMRDREDRVIWLRTRGKVVERDTDGTALRMVGTTTEITQRRRAEEALREREELLSLVLDASTDGFWDWSLRSGDALISQGWAEIVGIAPPEDRMPVSEIEALIHPEDLAACRARIAPLLEGGSQGDRYELEHRFLTPTGTCIWVRTRAKVVERDEQQKAVRICGTITDITSEKQAAERLRQSEHHARLLAENTSDCIWQMNLDGTYDYVNPAVERLLGYTVEEFLQTRMSDHFDAEEMARATARIAEYEARGGEEGLLYEAEMVHKDGHRVHVEILATPIYDDGKLVAFHGVTRNITERKRAEQERRDLEAQIQHTQKLESLGVLAGGIAHDFNNLLMGILGNADLALSDLSPVSPARENVEEIKRTSTRAADLCKQMLAYSGKGRFVVQPIRLSEVVNEMAHMLEVTISKKAILKYSFPKDLPCVEADVTQMRQVIMNLITNASEAIGDRNGIISVSTGVMRCDRAYLADTYVDEELPEGRYVYLEVADTGCGMSEEVRQRIFDPFFTTKFTGRGLGLAAVLGIIRGHHGALKVYTEHGGGTTLKVLLPACERAASTEPRSKAASASPLGTGTVLLVDDEAIVLSVGERMLRKLGFEVMTATDGAEAVRLYAEHRDEITCVILNLTMPHMDGEEAYRELRRIDPGVRVILSSGYNEQEVTQRFVGKGLAGFVQKPYQMSSLTEAMRALFDRGSNDSA